MADNSSPVRTDTNIDVLQILQQRLQEVNDELHRSYAILQDMEAQKENRPLHNEILVVQSKIEYLQNLRAYYMSAQEHPRWGAEEKKGEIPGGEVPE